MDISYFISYFLSFYNHRNVSQAWGREKKIQNPQEGTSE